MRTLVLHIIICLGFLIPATSFAQIYVSEGTVIANSESIVVRKDANKDSVKDQNPQTVITGKIYVASDEENLITIDSNTINNLEIVSVVPTIENNHLKNVATHSSKNSIEKTKKEVEDIAVHYINVEGISFVQPEKEEPQIITENKGEYGGGVIVTSNTFLQGVHSIRYSIPILYNYTLNERFSDYAKLYKFEYLTAIFHPPTV